MCGCMHVCICVYLGVGGNVLFLMWCRCDHLSGYVGIVLTVNGELVEGRNIPNRSIVKGILLPLLC